MDSYHPQDLYQEVKDKLLAAHEKYNKTIEKYSELISSPCAYCGVIQKSNNDEHKEGCREGILGECLDASIEIEYWTNQLHKRGSHI